MSTSSVHSPPPAPKWAPSLPASPPRQSAPAPAPLKGRAQPGESLLGDAEGTASWGRPPPARLRACWRPPPPSKGTAEPLPCTTQATPHPRDCAESPRDSLGGGGEGDS